MSNSCVFTIVCLDNRSHWLPDQISMVEHATSVIPFLTILKWSDKVFSVAFKFSKKAEITSFKRGMLESSQAQWLEPFANKRSSYCREKGHESHKEKATSSMFKKFVAEILTNFRGREDRSVEAFNTEQ